MHLSAEFGNAGALKGLSILILIKCNYGVLMYVHGSIERTRVYVHNNMYVVAKMQKRLCLGAPVWGCCDRVLGVF